MSLKSINYDQHPIFNQSLPGTEGINCTAGSCRSMAFFYIVVCLSKLPRLVIFTAHDAFDSHKILSQLLELNVAMMKEETLQSLMMTATLPELNQTVCSS